MAAPDEPIEHPLMEAASVEQQRYPVNDITNPIECELHVRAKNIFIHVAYGLALSVNHASTIHGMPIPPGYASITIEQIIGPNGDNENLEIDFIRGDGEKTLRDAHHGIVLWCEANIKLIGNTTAPMDPRSSPDYDNDDRDPYP